MSRGITVWEKCEHGNADGPHKRTHAIKRDDLLDLDGNALPPTWVYTDVECPGGRSVSLTRQEAESLVAVELHDQEGDIIEGLYGVAAEFVVDALLAVVDKEPQ